MRIALFLQWTSDYREFDWCLPFVAAFAKAGHQVQVVFPKPPDSERTQMLFTWAKEYAECRYFEEFDPLGPLHKILLKLRQRGGLSSKLVSPYLDFGHRIGVRIGVHQLRWRLMRMRVTNWIHGCQGVMLSYKTYAAAPGTADQLVEKCVLNSGLPVVWLPHGMAIPKYNAFESIGSQLHLVHNQECVELAERNGSKASISGAPRYTRAWFDTVTEYFEQKSASPPRPLRKDGQSVLIMLKNEYSIIWEGVDFETETRRLFNEWYDKDVFMVIKPHPGQDLNLLNRILSDFPAASFIVDNNPLSYWVQKVDYCCAQISSAALDPLAIGRPFVIHDPQRARSKNLSQVDKEVAREDRNFVERQVRFWFEEANDLPTDLKPEETIDLLPFDRAMRPDVRIEDAIKACERHFSQPTVHVR